MMFKPFKNLAHLSAVVAIVFASASPSSAAEPIGPSLVPASAGGFIHFHVADFLDSPALESTAHLLKRVRRELRELSERRLGVDISRLEEVTAIQENSAKNGPQIWAFTFDTRVHGDLILQRLGAQWKIRELKGHRVFVDVATNKAVYVQGDRTVFVANVQSLTWLLNQDMSETGPLTQSLALAKGRGQITVGVRNEIIPTELTALAPAPFQALTAAQGSAVSINLDRSLKVDFHFSFANPSQATAGKASLAHAVRYARAKLADSSVELEAGIKKQTTEFGEAVIQVFGLALVRFFDEALERAEIRQDSSQLTGTVKLEETGVASLLIVGITAIQAIGTNAEAAFDDVSSELNGTENSKRASRYVPAKSNSTFKSIADELNGSDGEKSSRRTPTKTEKTFDEISRQLGGGQNGSEFGTEDKKYAPRRIRVKK